MNRIDQCFERCRAENRKALVMFVSAGDPELAFTERLIPAIIDAGADIVEIGVPFSDPMADGPTIQAASERALAAGTNLTGIMAMIQRLRTSGVTAPFVLFGYYNVFLAYGVDRLAADCRTHGVDGCLVVDVPPEEDGEIKPAMTAAGLHKITLVAPTTPPDRLAALCADAQGFVYTITVTGVTGARTELPADLAEQLRRVAAVCPVPVVAGFGVADAETARLIASHVDGVVVGSKLVQTVADAPDPETALRQARDLVASLADALKSLLH